MRLYLYAIAERLGSLGDVTGIQREALTVVEAGAASVVAGWVEGLPAVSRETLVAQDSLVRALHARADALLPMRFGSNVDNVEALMRLLEPLAARVTECCALVRGREQMTMRVLRTRTEGAEGAEGASRASSASAEGNLGATGAEGAGAKYLAQRATKRTPSEVAPLVEALRDVQRATKIEQGRHADVVATIYQLIDRGSTEGYRQKVGAAADAMPHLTIRVSGPMPAYAFATLSEPSAL